MVETFFLQIYENCFWSLANGGDSSIFQVAQARSSVGGQFEAFLL
jgi:hypothetical protein